VFSPSLRTTGKSVDTLKQLCCHVNSTQHEKDDRQSMLHVRKTSGNEYFQDTNQNVVFTMQYLKHHDVCRSPLYQANHSHDWFVCIPTTPMNTRPFLVQPHFCKIPAFLVSFVPVWDAFVPQQSSECFARRPIDLASSYTPSCESARFLLLPALC